MMGCRDYICDNDAARCTASTFAREMSFFDIRRHLVNEWAGNLCLSRQVARHHCRDSEGEQSKRNMRTPVDGSVKSVRIVLFKCSDEHISSTNRTASLASSHPGLARRTE